MLPSSFSPTTIGSHCDYEPSQQKAKTRPGQYVRHDPWPGFVPSTNRQYRSGSQTDKGACENQDIADQFYQTDVRRVLPVRGSDGKSDETNDWHPEKRESNEPEKLIHQFRKPAATTMAAVTALLIAEVMSVMVVMMMAPVATVNSVRGGSFHCR